MTYFDSALGYLFQNEGGSFVDNPIDSGGPTKWGVTLKSFSEFLKIEITPEDIKNLTMGQVKPFYFEKYWMPPCCHKIYDSGIAIAIFDSSVLFGVGTISFISQRALIMCGQKVVLDGKIGQGTIFAFNSVGRPNFLQKLVLLLRDRIDELIKESPKNKAFENGWINRVNRLLTLNQNTMFELL